MRIVSRRLAVALLVVGWAHAGRAQTVDDVINKSLAAAGGRAALLKLKSRSMTGTITLATPAGDISGSVEILNAAPNKLRSVIKADLSALGAGQLVQEQRFDGTTGYMLDTLQGNRDITGNQLDNMRNGSFPSPYLNYKELGIAARLGGKEKVGEREAYVLIFEPPTGSVVRQFIDVETYLPMRTVVKIDVAQLGREVELTTDMLDYRDVDGVKVPFLLKVSSAIQNYTVTITKVEHNVPVDEKLFAKPATP
jgi:zinc protease